MGSDQISSLEGFLDYGPIGLAGLMLVLVVIALITRELTEVKADLLKFFMVVGGFCFSIALIAQVFVAPGSYRMNVAVVPSNLEEKPHAAPPALQIDGESFAHGTPHEVDRDFSMLIDLTSTVETAEVAMETARLGLEADLAALKESMVNEHSDLEQRLTVVAIELEKFKAIQDVLDQLQSDAPNSEVLKVRLQLNQKLRQFITKLGAAVN